MCGLAAGLASSKQYSRSCDSLPFVAVEPRHMGNSSLLLNHLQFTLIIGSNTSVHLVITHIYIYSVCDVAIKVVLPSPIPRCDGLLLVGFNIHCIQIVVDIYHI